MEGPWRLVQLRFERLSRGINTPSSTPLSSTQPVEENRKIEDVTELRTTEETNYVGER